MIENNPNVSPQQGKKILSLSIREKSQLFAAYMPFLKNGGLFIRTEGEYELQDEIFLLLELMDEPEKLPIVGRVIWITPKYAQANRPQGIGIQFCGDEAFSLSEKIEAYLSGYSPETPSLQRTFTL